MDTQYLNFAGSNRKLLLRGLPENSTAIFLNLNREVKNYDVSYPHHTNPNFYYFTGIRQRNSALLLVKNKNDDREILFLEPRNSYKETWEGKMLDFDTVSQETNIEQVLPIDELKRTIFSAQKNSEVIFIEYNEFDSDQPSTQNMEFLADLKYRLPGMYFKKMMPQIEDLRAKKSSTEIDLLKKATEIHAESFAKIFQKVRPTVSEAGIQADLEQVWKKYGGFPGFDTIVAGGKNALCLHYTNNNTVLKSGEMVLIDSGCNFQGYSCDVTRTLPVNGKFTLRQAELYQTVLNIQKKVINSIRVGMTMNKIYAMAKKVTEEEFKKINLIKKNEDAPKIALHRIGHSLGLDLHDPIDLFAPLKEGSVITIEPGLYLEKEAIGIRIEDNLLLKKKKIEILTQAIPKEIQEIEAAMSE